MVVRFKKPTKPRVRVLPLFDRLEALRLAPRLTLTSRQLEHRKRMLQHLTAARPASQ